MNLKREAAYAATSPRLYSKTKKLRMEDDDDLMVVEDDTQFVADNYTPESPSLISKIKIKTNKQAVPDFSASYLPKKDKATELAEMMENPYVEELRKELFRIPISDDLHLVALPREQNEVRIHLRRYIRENEASNEWEPSIAGVTLKLQGFVELLNFMDEIIAHMRRALIDDLRFPYKRHLGAHIFVSVSEQFPGANIRFFYVVPVTDEGEIPELKPTPKGIYIQLKEAMKLKEMMPLVINFLPEINIMKQCSKSHENEEAFTRCAFCCPLGTL